MLDGRAAKRGRRTEPPPTGAAGLRVRRFLIDALEQQMWFFGCDAVGPNGSLLERHGFRRCRQDLPRGRSSCYRCEWALNPTAAALVKTATATVELHGWCAGLHLDGGPCAGSFLYARAGNRVGWLNTREHPAPGDYDACANVRRSFSLLGCRPEPGFQRTAALFLLWMEEYERWVDDCCGVRHRERCHQLAPLPWLPPAQGRSWLREYREALLPGLKSIPTFPPAQ